jgi:hypothetical protein
MRLISSVVSFFMPVLLCRFFVCFVFLHNIEDMSYGVKDTMVTGF